MSIESVKAFFAAHAPDVIVLEYEVSTATVALAAAALNVEEGQIAKTLALRFGDTYALLVTAGHARLDNQKAKAAFGAKSKMLSPDETFALTGHRVGGVCPFGLLTELPVFCDVSLQQYAEVYPAAGSSNSAVCLTPERLAGLVNAQWVDACRS
ncbi:YbaK/EbsC family protein [Pseudomonas turukhanskensis]|uniref:Cys-tRNA(Pro)/cys-tRNA(Cys) deacylase n=1 Tax=Pseudomonas turukhanskensis TaxID=1806536 RepID=A0A9W6K5W5_9PSED|nr:YbaK/EbsC family protein [Pseudomonas turukhanskensis]GLK88833.1 cys-tRNA(pro)/cys-tRNA(cys) deacylase [Pseudomonas turukhanskensis]